MSQIPTARKVSVITQRSAAPRAASALTVSATGSKYGGCRLAAAVHPPISSTGAVTDETKPHRGTSRMIITVGKAPRSETVANVPAHGTCCPRGLQRGQGGVLGMTEDAVDRVLATFNVASPALASARRG